MLRHLTLNLYTISRYTHHYYARALKSLGLTMGQFPFVMGIAEHDGISQEKLAAELRVGKSTTAGIIQQLLEKGLATREVDPRDRRNFCLHATPEALALVPKIEAVIDRCHELLIRDLSPIESEVFADLARKVRERADAEWGRAKRGREGME